MPAFFSVRALTATRTYVVCLSASASFTLAFTFCARQFVILDSFSPGSSLTLSTSCFHCRLFVPIGFWNVDRFLYSFIITAQCYAERGDATASCLSVCPSVGPSVTMRDDYHVDWNTWKIMSRMISYSSAPLIRALLDCVARYKFIYVCMYAWHVCRIFAVCQHQNREFIPKVTPRNFSQNKSRVWKKWFSA